MLIFNSTEQIMIPSESLAGVICEPEGEPHIKFYSNGEEGDFKPVKVTVVGNGGIITFAEHYGSAEKAKEALNKLAGAWNSDKFIFPKDEKYAQWLEAKRKEKKRREEEQLPIYAQRGPKDGEGE